MAAGDSREKSMRGTAGRERSRGVLTPQQQERVYYRLSSAYHSLRTRWITEGCQLQPDLAAEYMNATAWLWLNTLYPLVEQFLKTLVATHPDNKTNEFPWGHALTKPFRELSNSYKDKLRSGFNSVVYNYHGKVPFMDIESFFFHMDRDDYGKGGYQAWRYHPMYGGSPPKASVEAMIEIASLCYELLTQWHNSYRQTNLEHGSILDIVENDQRVSALIPLRKKKRRTLTPEQQKRVYYRIDSAYANLEERWIAQGGVTPWDDANERETADAWLWLNTLYPLVEQQFKTLVVIHPDNKSNEFPWGHSLKQAFSELSGHYKNEIQRGFQSFSSIYCELKTFVKIEDFLHHMDWDSDGNEGYQTWRYYPMSGGRPPKASIEAMVEIATLCDHLLQTYYLNDGENRFGHVRLMEQKLNELFIEYLVRNCTILYNELGMAERQISLQRMIESVHRSIQNIFFSDTGGSNLGKGITRPCYMRYLKQIVSKERPIPPLT